MSHERLVVVGPTPPPMHGVAVMTGEVLEALAQLGCLSGHVDTRDDRPLATIGRLDLINVWLGIKHVAMLWRASGRDGTTTVYLPISQATWGFVRDAALVAVAKLRRKRLILHLHGGHFRGFYEDAGIVMRWLIRVVCRQATEAWALTPSLQDQYAGLVEGNRVKCVGNVVPDLQESDQELPPPTDRFKLLYLSNLLPEKGCFELMAALRSLGTACRGWEVCIAGPATEDVERRLRAEAERLADGGATVHFAGEIHGQEKIRRYLWADLFVYPTYYQLEGQPLVLLEALAAGLAVVSTRHAGIPETVRDGVEGVLVEPRDTDALARALSNMSVDEVSRRRCAAAARERYTAKYSRERLAADLADACEVVPVVVTDVSASQTSTSWGG